MLAAALLVACDGSSDTGPTDTEPTDSDVPTGTTTTADTAHTEDTVTVEPPDLTALEASLQASIDLLPTLSMLPCYGAWRAVSFDQEPTCPEYLTVGTTLTWETICVTVPGGTTYGGILTTTFDQTEYVVERLDEQVMDRFGEEVVPSWTDGQPFGGDALTGIGMDGSVHVYLRGSLDPDFLLGGQGTSVTVTDAGLTLRHHRVEGLCEAANAPEGTWLGTLSPWIHINQLSAEGDDTYLTEVDGSLGGLPAPYTTISYEDLTYRPDALPGTSDPDDLAPPARCDLEPSGALELRADDGHVWRVTFDPDLACDGCGEVTGAGGTSAGSVCADFGVMGRPMADTTLAPGARGANARAAPSTPAPTPEPLQALEPRFPSPAYSLAPVRLSSSPVVSSPIVQELSP